MRDRVAHTPQPLRIGVVLGLLVLQVLGLWAILARVQTRAEMLHLQMMTNQVETTARVLDLVFSQLFKPEIHDFSDLTFDELAHRIEGQPFPLLRYEQTVSARFLERPDGAVELIQSPYNTIPIETVREYLSASSREGDSIWFPLVSPDRQILAVRHPTQDNGAYGYMIDIGAILDDQIAGVTVGEIGSYWVVDDTGRVLYDVEPEIIGESILDLHTDYPTLVRVDRRILGEPSGTDRYRFIHRASGEQIEKIVSWRRVILGTRSISIAMSASAEEISVGIGEVRLIAIGMAILSLVIMALYLVFSQRRELDRAHRQEQRLQHTVDERTAELAESERRFRTFFEAANDAVIVAETATGIVADVNMRAEELFGRSREELIGLHQTQLHPQDELEAARQSFNDAETRIPGHLYSEFHAQHSSGRRIPVEISTSVIQLGGVEYAYGIFRDVSKRKEAEAQLAALAEERERLIKEVLHRSKNNLALVSSLLNIQMHALRDSDTRQLLRSAEERIQLMVELQELLYETELFEKVPLGRYLSGIATRVIDNYRLPGVAVQLVLPDQTVDVPAKLAINLGLIVNELLTNAMKYAFSGRAAGRIALGIDACRGILRSITVTDDGVGMDPDRSSSPEGSLGMTLVYGISDQIEAEVTRTSVNGTQWTFTFPDVPEEGDETTPSR